MVIAIPEPSGPVTSAMVCQIFGAIGSDVRSSTLRSAMVPVAVTCAEPVSRMVLAGHDVLPTNTVPTGGFGAEVRAEPDTTVADASVPGGPAGPAGPAGPTAPVAPCQALVTFRPGGPHRPPGPRRLARHGRYGVDAHSEPGHTEDERSHDRRDHPRRHRPRRLSRLHLLRCHLSRFKYRHRSRLSSEHRNDMLSTSTGDLHRQSPPRCGTDVTGPTWSNSGTVAPPHNGVT